MNAASRRIQYVGLLALALLFLNCSNGKTIPLKSAAPPRPAISYSYLYSTADIVQKSQEIKELLMRHDFETVDAILKDLLGKKVYTKNGNFALKSILDRLSKEEYIGPHLDAWCNTSDASSFAFTSRGVYLVDKAWQVRGSDYGYTVTEGERETYRELLTKAYHDFEIAYGKNPADPSAASQAIVVCMGLGLPEKTMNQWFERAVKVDPKFDEPYRFKLDYLLPKWYGSWEKASEFAAICYKNAPPKSRVYLVKTAYLLEKVRVEVNQQNSSEPRSVLERRYMQKTGIFDEIASIYKRYRADFPQSTTARLVSAKLYQDIGDIETAIEYCNQGISIDPQDARLYSQRAGSYIELKKYEDALTDFHNSLKVYPNDSFTWSRIGYIYLMAKSYDQALAAYDKAVELDPKKKSYYLYRGYIYGKRDRYEQAVNEYLKALAIDPKFAAAYQNLGRLYYNLNRYTFALEILSKGIAVKPNAQLYYLRGLCHYELENYADAVDDFSATLKYNASYSAAVIKRRDALAKLGRNSIEIEDLTKAIANDPTVADYYFKRAYQWLKVENYPKAYEDLKEARRLNPQNATYLKFFNRVEAKLNEISAKQ